MEPLLFQTLPGVFNFVAAVVLIQISVYLLLTGRRHLKKVSIAAVALIAAVIGERIGLALLPAEAWVFIVAGLAGGAILGHYLRPVGVGLVLAFLGHSLSANVVGFEYIDYVTATVLFAYGLLLTDLAPTFVSSLVSSSILLLLGVWAGASTPAILVLASAVAAARIMASVLPSRLSTRRPRPFLG